MRTEWTPEQVSPRDPANRTLGFEPTRYVPHEGQTPEQVAVREPTGLLRDYWGLRDRGITAIEAIDRLSHVYSESPRQIALQCDLAPTFVETFFPS